MVELFYVYDIFSPLANAGSNTSKMYLNPNSSRLLFVELSNDNSMLNVYKK